MNWKELTKGIWRENPLFVLMLGCCPSLATSTSVENALGMGIAATVVLVGSNIFLSMIRSYVPPRIRIPVYILVIATLVTMIEKSMAAFTPGLSERLGIFIPLIVVNCIILGRVEAFAKNHGPIDAALDGAGMGMGFILAITLIAAIRELLGAGSLLGFPIPVFRADPCLVLIMAPGGFFVFGLLMALRKHLSSEDSR